MVRNYNLRAQLGDVLHDIFLPRPSTSRQRDVPASIALDPLAGGQSFLLSDAYAQETLAPSLLLLYGEVEHTGYYDKMTHRAKIASLIHYLWESSEHRPAFRRITQNQTSFIKFANGIMNETNTLIATVMQKLPEIREAQEKMKNANGEWNRLSEDERSQITSRLEDNERDVKSSLPLCNKTLQMFGYLNTDNDIRNLFLLPELCSRLVAMLLHVLTKLVGSKGLDLKVDNPEQYDFRPKEMLRDLCAIFALFAASSVFQEECAKSGCDPTLLRSAVKTCRRLHLLEGESMEALSSLPDAVATSQKQVAQDEALLVNAPDEFLDEILSTFMKDPVKLPSGHFVDRATITQHLLNDPMDPFSREPLTLEQVEPAVELQQRMQAWLREQQMLRQQNTANDDPMEL
jgi:ubiquitin conjugation factor E4 B